MSDKKLYKNEIRITDIKSVQRLLARTTNQFIKGEIKESELKAITYTCNTMIMGFKTDSEVALNNERIRTEQVKNGIVNEELEDDGYEEATKELKDIEAFDKKIIESGIVD